MNRLRLALVTRRFWPLTGEAELTTASLAAGLHQRGHACTIVTPKHGKHWPTDIYVREVPIVRFPCPPPQRWGNMRFLYALSNWLQRQRSELDAVIVEGFEDDALSVVSALRNSPVAVVVRTDAASDAELRPAQGGIFSDRLKRRWQEASAFVASSPTAAEHLTAIGVPAERITTIPLGVEPQPACSPARREAARQSLAEINHDLAAPLDAPVALCISPLLQHAHLEALVRAWRSLPVDWPNARLWIVGDGPLRDPLFRLISDFGLKYRIVLPGIFDNWCDLLAAADLVIQPAPLREWNLVALEAMAAGLPLVAAASPESPLAQQHGQIALTVPPDDAKGLTTTIAQLLDRPADGVGMGVRAREWASEHHPLDRMLDQYEALLATLVADRARMV